MRFERYLSGRTFTLVTDATPLLYLKTMKYPKGKLGTWAMALQAFDFEAGIVLNS